MTASELTQAMSDAGAPIEAILIALRAVEAAKAEGEAHRTAARERKRRQRDKSRDGHVTVPETVTAEVTGQVTPKPSPLPPSPQTPQPPTPAPGSVSTRGREATAASLPGADRLARFWTVYPRKVGKRNAVAAYLAAVRRLEKASPDADPHAVIADGLDRLLAGWAEREPDLIPHPATWLNRDGWEDQPDSPRQPRLIHDRGPRQPAGTDKLHAVAGAMRQAFGSG